MNNDKLYQNFYSKWKEVTDLPTQTVGPFTPLYKLSVPWLKIAPWRILVPLAIILVSITMFLLEVTSPQIASILQRAF